MRSPSWTVLNEDDLKHFALANLAEDDEGHVRPVLTHTKRPVLRPKPRRHH